MQRNFLGKLESLAGKMFKEILNQLTRIADATEKLANIEKQPAPLPSNSNFQLLANEDNNEKELDRKWEAATKEGYLFPEDAMPLEMLEEQ
jgi:hypothetical protein